MKISKSQTTLDSIAGLVGVSRATVSRVVNNHPNVSQAVRARVRQALEQQGYRPHIAARALASRRGHAIGLVIPNTFEHVITDGFFSLIARGVSATCLEHGQFMTLLTADINNTSPCTETFQRMLGSGYHAGAIIVGFNQHHPVLDVLARNRLPFVSIGQQSGMPEVPYVDVDNFGGAREATQHLLSLGHTRIGHISGQLQASWVQHRISGYREALEGAGIKYDNNLLLESDFTREGGYAAMQRMLAHEPTAVFVGGEAMTVGAMEALQAAGVSVPNDISVISFDGLPTSATIQPALTAVTQPVLRLGRMAVEMLLSMLEDGAASEEQAQPRTSTRAVSRIVPTELIVRASTSAPSGHAAAAATKG